MASYLALFSYLGLALTIALIGCTPKWPGTLQFGSPVTDVAQDIAVAANGRSYVVGWTNGSLSKTANLGSTDVFIRAFEADGSLRWTQQFGSTQADYAYNIQHDHNGDLYVCGSTQGNLPAQQHHGASDSLIAKVSGSGELLWTTQLGGASNDNCQSLRITDSGNILIAGTSASGFSNGQSLGGGDAYVALLDADGELLWQTLLGTNTLDTVRDISVDELGQISLVGSSQGQIDGAGVRGLHNLYIAQLNSSGELLWQQIIASQVQPNSELIASAIVHDSYGNLYINATGSRFGPPMLLNHHLFKLSPEGDFLWEQLLASSDHAQTAADLLIRDNDQLIAAGIDTSDSDNSLFIAAINPLDGSIDWQRHWGQHDPWNGGIQGISGNDEAVYVTGNTYGQFAGQMQYGESDAFIAKFDLLGQEQ